MCVARCGAASHCGILFTVEFMLLEIPAAFAIVAVFVIATRTPTMNGMFGTSLLTPDARWKTRCVRRMWMKFTPFFHLMSINMLRVRAAATANRGNKHNAQQLFSIGILWVFMLCHSDWRSVPNLLLNNSWYCYVTCNQTSTVVQLYSCIDTVMFYSQCRCAMHASH